MIKKWRNLSIIFGLATVFLAIVGYYLFADIVSYNNQMDRLKTKGEVVTAKLAKLPSVTYSDEGYFLWGYVIPVEYDRKGSLDGVTTARYSVAECEEMGYETEVYYVFDKSGALFTKDKLYVDAFKPWFPTQGVVFWVFAALTLGLTIMYLVRNLIATHIIKNGETAIGKFEEARSTFFGSMRYKRIKYSYEGEDGRVTVTSPPIYDAKVAEELRGYETLIVKYIGKRSYVDPRI